MRRKAERVLEPQLGEVLDVSDELVVAAQLSGRRNVSYGERDERKSRGLQMRWRRRSSAMFVVGLGLATLVPPASASYYEEGISFRTRITRDSVSYPLHFKVIRPMGGETLLRVTIGTSVDPAGVARFRQRQTWTYSLEADDFVEDGDTWRIDAGGPNEPFDIDVVVERREGAACSDDAELFVTEASGARFRIETDNATFGTITELPPCAGRWFFGSGTPHGVRCPVRGDEVYSSPLNVTEHRRRDVARLRYFAGREREISGQPVQWFVELRGAFPQHRFSLNRHLDGTLIADGLPWLTGVAEIRSRGPLVEQDWYNCKGGREARGIQGRGSIEGDLAVEVIGYDRHTVRDQETFITRSWVRPRR